jgi:phthiocerol/phenolphthiocerol synthesis type-I polyketide synthase E
MNGAVAIIGLACRFPGAVDADAFWRLLRDGQESIARFTETPPVDAPGYVAAAGVVPGIDHFDADYFGLTPRAAQILDPQQRLFLQACADALHCAGYDPARCRAAVGVFGGQARSSYYDLVRARRDLVRVVGERAISIGNDKDHLATGVAYRLDLKGPAVTVQTACSTSLVAVHLAAESLLGGECDMALAGGVSLRVPQEEGYVPVEGLSSRDGHCRTFDAAADGTVPSGGVGVVLLKLLENALRDGDVIRAVLRASAVNNDGSGKVGYTAPSVEGQEAVIVEALELGGVDARDVSYIEAHGTATPLGDVVELGALTAAFRRYTSDNNFCRIGSVKTNIGHPDTAAGVAGLIKTVLALENRLLPPSLHFEEPNPELSLDASPFVVNAELSAWQLPEKAPAVAGVSSFGIGGTNAHVIVEAAPARDASADYGTPEMFIVSGHTPAALAEAVAGAAGALDDPRVSAVDLAYTLRVGRPLLQHRLAVLAPTRAEAASALRSAAERRESSGTATPVASVVFVFAGGGAEHPRMVGDLYLSEDVFRSRLDEAAETLAACGAPDVRKLLVLNPGGKPPRPELWDVGARHASLFAVELAAAALYRSWGLEPAALLGHSLGHYVAATLADVVTLDEAARLVVLRAEVFSRLPAGTMTAVALSEAEVRPLLPPELDIAAVNTPSSTVVAGELHAMDALERSLARRGVVTRRLDTVVGAHSPLLDAVREDFVAEVATVRLEPPRIPVVSTLDGGWLQDAEAIDPAYWGRHLREPVRFSDALELLVRGGPRLFIELAPGRGLSSLARRHPLIGPDSLCVAALPHQDEARAASETAYAALAKLWEAGADVAWERFRPGHGRRSIAPPFPWQRVRHWVDVEANDDRAASATRDLVGSPGGLIAVVDDQLELMAQQLRVLRDAG